MRGSRTLAQCLAACALLTASLVTIPVIAVADPPASGPGSLASSFGDGGIATLPAPGGLGAVRSLNRMYVQSDGKVLVGALTNVSHQTVVYRLNADGTLDTGFGGGNGYIVDAHAITSGEADAAIGEDAAGNVYVGGGVDTNSGSALFLSRYDSNGAPDTAYGNAGTSVISSLINAFGANPVNDHITDLVAGPNGTMLATAWVGQGGGADFVVLRFTSNGALDPTFGAPVIEGSGRLGYVWTNFHSGDDTARSLALQSDGKIVVAGFVKSADSGPDNVGLARYTADGALDTTFGVNGRAETDFAGGYADGAWSVDVAADDTLNVAATDYHSNQAVVARYSADGALETSFNSTNNTGKGLHDTFAATSASAFSIAHDSDGRILLAGPANVSVETSATSPGVDRFVDAAYPLDTTWNSTGRELLACTNAANVGGSVATTASGDVLTSYSCGGKLEVTKLNGGNEVPVGSTIVGGAANYNQFTITNVDANGTGTTTARVAPGGSFSISLSYTQTQSQTNCPSCIDQIQLGFPNDYPSQCAYDSTVPGGSASGTYSGTFTAPPKRGTYYLGAQANQLYHCLDGGWTSQPGPSLYIAKIIVGGVTSISVDADRSTAPAGHLRTPTSSIPGDALQGAVGTDMQAAPLRSTPLRSTPLRSTPLRSTPLRSTPLRSTPLRSTPLRSTAIDIPLSDAPLVAPKTWTDVLDGPPATPFAGTPLQTVTLHDVLTLPAGVYPQVDALTMDDIDWSQVSEVRNLSLAAFLLGDTPLSHLPAPASGWCTYLVGQPSNCGTGTTFPDNHSLADVQLAGDDVSSYLSSTDIPLGDGSTLVASPLPAMVLADVELSMTKYSDVPAGGYATCSGCSLSEAESNGTLSVSATLHDLLADNAMPRVSLGDVLPGIIPASELPYDQVPLATVIRNSAAPAASDLVKYTVQAGLDCVSSDTLAIGVQLPPGFEYQDGSAALDLNGDPVTPLTVTDGAPPVSFVATTTVLTRINSVIVSAPVSCTGASHATLTLEVEPGVELGGPFTTVATASFEQSRLSATGAPVTVVDHQPPSPSVINTIYLGHVSQPGDVDQYTIGGGSGGFAAGSQITASLTNIPSGQDFDLVAFGPAAPDLRSSPLRSTPLRSTPLRSTAVTDTSLDPQSDGTSAPPDPEADVPTTPPSGETFLSSSRNRGSVSDSLTVTVGDGQTGNFTLQVSGYNGSWDTSPYMLRISVTPPAGELPCATLTKAHDGEGVAGTLPSSPPSGTKTLILVNQQRLGDFYGAADAGNVMSALHSFATANDGVVVPVEGDSTVAQAYSDWDNAPCSPAAADSVVAAINNLVDNLRSGLTDLRYLVIVGNDQIVPFARVPDHTAVSNERDYGAAAFDGHDNAISRALTDGYLLTDDAYSSFNPTPWLDSALYVPNVATGRLVETPTDIVNALTAFHDSSGIRAPLAAYTTGYDFMTSEANAINSALSHNLSGLGTTSPTTSSNIDDGWTKQNAVDGVDAAPGGILSVNAHYDNYRALPNDQFNAGTQDQLLSTADLPADMAGSIMFTIGCHAGLNLADTFVASPTSAQSAKLLDWSQAVSAKGGEFVGNTGFGYGDTDTIAYSAAMMVQLAKNLDGSMTVGQALMYAKQAYLHLPMGVYDAKAMEEATFYGLPMYKLGSGGHEAAPSLPDDTTVATSTPTAVGGAPVSVDIGPDGSTTDDPHFVSHPKPEGTYYTVRHATGVDDPPLVVQNEPIEPQTTVTVPKPGTGPQTAHGISLDELSTYATSASGFDPVFDKPAVVGTFTHEPGIDEAFFPATIDGLVAQQTPAGPADVAVLTPGTFRSNSGSGIQTLANHMRFHLNYSDSNQFEPPTIDSTDGIVTSPGNVSFTVHAHGVDPVTRVTVLFLPQQFVGTPTAWQEVVLGSSGPGTWTGAGTYTGPSTTVGQYIVQATDASGNVTESANKGRDFSAVPPPSSDLGAPVISPAGPQVNGVFTEPPQVTITGRGPLKYSLDNAPFQSYGGQFTITQDGTHLITAKDVDGAIGTRVVVVETSPPTVSITTPADGATYLFGEVPTPVFSCTSPTVIQSCTPSPTTPTQNVGTNTNTFSVTATDSAGRATTATVHYSVGKRTTTTTVSCASPVLAGQSNTLPCTATVADASLTTIDQKPSGTVTFSSSDSTVVSDGGTTSPVSCSLTPSSTPGASSCIGYLPAVARGTATINAHYAGDGAYLASDSSTGAAAKVWQFVGFLQPINDPPGSATSLFKYGSTIPVKFQLKDETGALLSDAVAQGMVNASSCQANLSLKNLGGSSTGVDEQVVSTTPDSGTCFRYDATADQFIFNLNSKTMIKGNIYNVIATLTGTVVGKHYVAIGSK